MKDNCTNNIRRNVHVNTMTDMKDLIRENVALKDKVKELTKAIESLTGYNLPQCYDSFEDSVGNCPYCGNPSYIGHSKSCEVRKAEELISD